MNISQAHPVRTFVAALVGSVICCVFSLPTNLDAQVFRPEKGAMWDPSILWHDGTVSRFHDVQQGRRERARRPDIACWLRPQTASIGGRKVW